MLNKKSDDVLLSIVIPTYNVIGYIQKCIDSIINQNSKEIELIIVNDGSTDGCDILLDELYAKNSKIKIINQSNSGISSARNRGISESRGKYIQLIDGDDELMSGSLISLISCLKKNTPDILMTDYIKAWPDGGRYYQATNIKIEKNKKIGTSESDVLSKIYDNSELYAWRFIVRKDILVKSPFDNGFVFEDIRNIPSIITMSDSFFYLPVISVIYNQRPNSIMHTKSLKNIMDLSSSTKRFSELAGKEKLTDNTIASHNAFSIKVFIWSIQDLIISGYLNADIDQIIENREKSIIGDGNDGLDKLKKIDKKNYRIYMFLSNKKITKLIFSMLNVTPKTHSILRYFYKKM